jgi:hypothetical protein
VSQCSHRRPQQPLPGLHEVWHMPVHDCYRPDHGGLEMEMMDGCLFIYTVDVRTMQRSGATRLNVPPRCGICSLTSRVIRRADQPCCLGLMSRRVSRATPSASPDAQPFQATQKLPTYLSDSPVTRAAVTHMPA